MHWNTMVTWILLKHKNLSYFHRFFDMLNTRHLEEGIKKGKPNLAPYRTCKDSRFKVNFAPVIKMCSTVFILMILYIIIHALAGN